MKPRIRPLSEAKAIDSGANFISEAFLFFVAGSLIVFESWRSRRKENNRREDVADRLAGLEESERNARQALAALEKEILALESGEKRLATKEHNRILPQAVWEQVEREEKEMEGKAGFWSYIRGFVQRRDGSGTNKISEPSEEVSSKDPIQRVDGEETGKKPPLPQVSPNR